MRTPRPFVLALTTLALAGVTATAASPPAQSITDSYASLVGGVDALHWSFTASTLQLLSATAFPVAVGEHGAYVAASVYGEGRCVAFGHEGMMLSGDGGVAAQRLRQGPRRRGELQARQCRTCSMQVHRRWRHLLRQIIRSGCYDVVGVKRVLKIF